MKLFIRGFAINPVPMPTNLARTKRKKLKLFSHTVIARIFPKGQEGTSLEDSTTQPTIPLLPLLHSTPIWPLNQNLLHLPDALHNAIREVSCLLSQTGRTSCAGWIHKSNFADSPSESVQLSTARKLATVVMEKESCLYSQMFASSENIVADACSRDFHLSDLHLKSLILSHATSQVLFGFRLCPLQPEITSWLTSLLQWQPLDQPWSQEPTRSKLWLGNSTLTYLHSIAITKDPYLEQFNKFQRLRILGAFAQALRDCLFHPKRTIPIKSQQCRASVDCGAQAYIMANRPDPRLDTDGKHAFLLLRLYRG